MTALYARRPRAERMRAAMTEPGRIAAALDGTPVPTPILDWLGRLHTLLGVPFGYLVPDEEMLPPESIRFFRLDEAWVEALIDGAFSLGRDLTLDSSVNHTAAIDKVVLGPVTALARAAAPVHRLPAHHRAARLRAAGPPVLSLLDGSGRVSTGSGQKSAVSGPASQWTGFLLRSSVVAAYPGLGVNVYPTGHTPDDPQPITLEVKRLDRLGPDTDTLFCLVAGDAYRVDLHEAPEQLHYGLDSYPIPTGGGTPAASKFVHAFDRAADGTITFRTQDDHPVILTVDLSSSLRAGSPRVIDLQTAAQSIGTANGTGPLDSAQLGFAMTAGVGTVIFLHRATAEPRDNEEPNAEGRNTEGRNTEGGSR